MRYYRVKVKDMEYDVEVEQIGTDTSTTDAEHSAEMVFEAIKNEYDHCVARSEKLDNKVYILLTICAFVFAFATSIYSKISSLTKPETIEKEILLIVFIVLLMSNTVLFIYLLYKLVELLKGQRIKRLDPMDLMKEDVFNLDKKTASRTISMIYLDAMTMNNQNLEMRFQEYNRCSKCLFPIILISIILSILSNFL